MTIFPIPSLLVLVLTSALDVLEWLIKQPVEIFHGYSSALHWVADSVRDLFEEYGYWVVFFGTLSENTLLVGLVVPGALVVILAGLAAHDGTISIPISIALGICGTILGDTISYCMGRYGWSRFGHVKMLADLSEKVREPLMRRGVWFVLFYHFAGYTRVIGPTAAGLLRMPYRRWAMADYGGAVLWVFGYFAIGYGLGIAGISLDNTDRWMRIVEWGLLIAAVLWIQMMIRTHTELFGDKQSNDQPELELQDPDDAPVSSIPQEEAEPTL